jgi:hypothetical protein
MLGPIRAAMDAKYGAGVFNTAVNNAFAAWASVANLAFIQKTDNGAPFAGTTAIDIRVGAYTITGASDVGGIGYGPPRDAVNFPNALVGDIAFSLGHNFQIASRSDATPLPLINGQHYNGVESLMLHEIGRMHSGSGTARTRTPSCGYVVINGVTYDGSPCTKRQPRATTSSTGNCNRTTLRACSSYMALQTISYSTARSLYGPTARWERRSCSSQCGGSIRRSDATA